MKFSIKSGGGVGFARKENYEYDGTKYEADIKAGDIVTILDSGTMETGTYGDQYNFKIKTRNGEKKIGFNQSTINVLVQEFGEDSENWVNKNVKVLFRKAIIAGKKCIVTYLVTSSWFLDEYGELVKNIEVDSAMQSFEMQGAPTPEKQGVTLSDIPF